MTEHEFYSDVQKVVTEYEQQTTQLAEVKSELQEILTYCDLNNQWSKKDIALKLQTLIDSIQ
jgi:hypothetical protein